MFEDPTAHNRDPLTSGPENVSAETPSASWSPEVAEDPDLATLSDEALERELCGLAAHLAVAECRMVLLVAETDRREIWGPFGPGGHRRRRRAVG